MTKIELEAYCKRLEDKNDAYYRILKKLSDTAIANLTIYKNGLAEDSEYNNGVFETLKLFTNILSNECGKAETVKDINLPVKDNNVQVKDNIIPFKKK